MTDTSHRFASPRDAAYFAKEAALIGARQAFSRPSSAASQQPHRPNASVLQSSWNSAHNKPTPPPPLPATSSSSVPLSSSTSASIQRTDSVPSLQSPSISTTQVKSPSPSNLAAGAAVFRSREIKEKLPEPAIQDLTDILRPGVSRLGHAAPPLPPTNLTEQNRIAQSSPSNVASTTISNPKTRPRKPSKPVQLEGRNARPTLSIDTPKTPAGAFIKAATTSPEIHSPKPVRPTSTAASFEAATAQQQEQEQRSTSSQTNGPIESASLPTADPSANGRDPQKRLPQAPPMPMPPPPRRNQNTTGTTTTFPVHYARPANARTVSQSSLASLQDESQRIDALANAIVGAHLASSRASSPAKSPIPGWARQGERTPAGGPFKGYNPDSRTPSPGKRMRQTLRKTPQPEPEEDPNARRARGPFHFRQHPHKHHEGDRKRWRDEISHEERKRYEGVWAANRDVYMRFTEGELLSPLAMEKIKGQVSGLVVKDIWSRSRLPQHELEEIWALVDRQKQGRLDREEFVVGLWLVDQRLKGRKIPSKVGSSVWQSVRGIYGLKVPKRKD